MHKLGILVADGARARFITLEPRDELPAEDGAQLVEHSSLVNPEGDLPGRELFSDRAGRSHGSPSGSAHGTDDHRSEHQLELLRRFARRVLDEAQRLAHERSLAQLVIAAEPRLLGILRGELEHHPLAGLNTVDLAQDLSRRSLSDIADILDRQGLLPSAQLGRAGSYDQRGHSPS